MIDIDFIILGAQKCATTWMYEVLKQHPGIAMPRKKRERCYIGSSWFKNVGPDAYGEKYAQHNHHVVGDISVDYLYDKGAADAVEAYARNARFILCLRDPLHRALSAYAWLLRKGKLDDHDASATFARALHGDASTAEKELLTRGFYDEQCKRYLDRFDPNRFLVINFDEIAKRPERVYQAMLQHLGVKTTKLPYALGRVPKKNSHTAALVSIQRMAPESAVLGKLMDYAHQGVARMGLATAAPTLDDTLAQKLGSLYRPHIERLDAILSDVPDQHKLVQGSFSTAWGC